MNIQLERTTRVSSVLLCAIGLGVATFTGCEKPSGDEASANAPSSGAAGSEEAPSEDPPDPSGETPDPTSGEQGSAGKSNPKPSAGESGMGEKPGEAGDISDEELRKFIEVTETLRPKKAELKKSLDEAETPQEAKKAQKKVMEETRKAADEVGLDFDRFRAISRRAKADPDLQQRLRDAAAEKKVGE